MTIKLENDNSQDVYICSRIDYLWTKLDRDRRTTLDVTVEVQQHLTYGDKDTLYGRLPEVKEVSESLKAQIENSCLKSADSLFNVSAKDDNQAEFALIQKASILNAIDEGKIITAYKEAIEKWIDRGELILFHEWMIKKGKKRAIKEIASDETAIDEIKKEYKYDIESYTEYEGPAVRAIEPRDFVFDTTKLNHFYSSRCFKIVRSWLTYEEIINNPLYKPFLTKEKKDHLKNLIVGSLPRTEQNFDDYNNRITKMKVDGDLIEILEYYGDIRLEDGSILEDYILVVAGRDTLIRKDESPYTKCPFVWIPYFSDLKTRRGFSALVDIVGFNEKSTKIWNSMLEAMEFSINPAYIAKNGCHIINKKDKFSPGDILQVSDASDGSGTLPVPIESFKNVPMNFELLTYLENEIEKASGVSKNMMGNPDHPEMTATQTQQIISGSSMRLSRRLMILAEEAIIPSIEIIARMIAENTDYDQIDKVKYKLSDGQEKTAIVDDAIRSGEYKYTIGSTQSIIEKKAKIQELAGLITQFVQLGVKFDNAKLWNLAAQAYEIPDASQLIESDGLNGAISKFPINIT